MQGSALGHQKAGLLLGALSLLVVLTPVSNGTPAAAGTGFTYLHLTSETGDVIGGGTNRHFTTSHAPISAASGPDRLRVSMMSETWGNWYFSFASAAGEPIGIGPYENAEPDRGGNPMHPGIEINWSDSGCSILDTQGRFEVLELEVDTAGDVTRVAVDFDARCGSAVPVFHGELRYEASSETYPPAPDGDGDGIPDTMDSCPAVPSPITDDADGDRVADPCDPDFTLSYLYHSLGSSRADIFMRPADALMTAGRSGLGSVWVRYDYGDDYHQISFGGPRDQPLTVGTYEGVTDELSNDHGRLNSHNLDSCSAIHGSFEILELEVLDDEVVRFSADFAYGCYATSQSTIQGSVRLNMDSPPIAMSGTGHVAGVGTAGMTIDAVAVGQASVLGRTTTSTGGAFNLLVPPTPFNLRASAPGAAPQWWDGHVFEELTRVIPHGVLDSSGVDVDIHAGSAIAGTANPVSGDLLKELDVFVYDTAGNPVTERTDAFNVWKDHVNYYEVFVPAGDYRVFVLPWQQEYGWPFAPTWYPQAPDFFSATTVTVGASDVAYADVGLPLAVKLDVSVVDPEGKGVDHAYTEVFNPLDITGMAADSNYRVGRNEWIVPEGEWYALGANYDESDNILWDYFPEWFDGAPELRPDLATPVHGVAGERVNIEIMLDPLFPDMFGSVFVDDIYWLRATGITTGCEGGIRFCTDDNVTRGQMAAFLTRALGLTDTGGVRFVDDDDSIFERDIEKLAAAGITRGCNPPINDRFCPDSYVTRQQMAAFLTRALGLAGGPGSDFIDDNGSVFEDEIEALAAAGITVGCNPPSNDRFCPGLPVTRGQMAAFLHRALTTSNSAAQEPNGIAGDFADQFPKRRALISLQVGQTG